MSDSYKNSLTTLKQIELREKRLEHRRALEAKERAEREKYKQLRKYLHEKGEVEE